MVVVHPDDVSTLVVLYDAVCERLANFHVKAPRVVKEGLALGVVRDNVVEDWPKDGLAVVCIVTVKVLVVDIDSKSVVLLLELLIDLGLLVFVKSVGRETNKTHVKDIIEFLAIDSGADGIAESTVALDRRHNRVL
jgi:hypothetical protein